MPDLGTKYECTNCGTKFYDLGKPEPLCPKCGTLQVKGEDSLLGVTKAARRKRKGEVAARGIDDELAEIESFPADDDAPEPDLDDDDLEDFGEVEEEDDDADDDLEP